MLGQLKKKERKKAHAFMCFHMRNLARLFSTIVWPLFGDGSPTSTLIFNDPRFCAFCYSSTLQRLLNPFVATLLNNCGRYFALLTRRVDGSVLSIDYFFTAAFRFMLQCFLYEQTRVYFRSVEVSCLIQMFGLCNNYWLIILT